MAIASTLVVAFIVILFSVDFIQFSVGASVKNVPTMVWAMSRDPELMQFARLARNDERAREAFARNRVTVFAPTDEAIASYQRKHRHRDHRDRNDDDVDDETPSARCHIVDGATVYLNDTTTIDDETPRGYATLDDTMPRLWLTTRPDGRTYVNNARVLLDRSDVPAMSRPDSRGKHQVLHKIDRVLVPRQKYAGRPNAYDFLSATNHMWSFEPTVSLERYHRAVIASKMDATFKTRNGTFFVTADELLDSDGSAAAIIDADAIRCGIVDHAVMFTRATVGASYLSSNGRCRLKLIRRDAGSHRFALQVTDLTHHHDNGVGSGTTYETRVVQADVPLDNGVAHVVDKVIGSFGRKPFAHKFPYDTVAAKLGADHELSIFSRLLDRCVVAATVCGGGSPVVLTNVTVIAPSDAAWIELMRRTGISVTDLEAHKDLPKFLGRHVVQGRHSLDRLVNVTADGAVVALHGAKPFGGDTYVTFQESVGGGGAGVGRPEVSVLWSSVRAEVTRADYECTDGLVHTIDRPLIVDAEVEGTGKRHSVLFNMWDVVKKIKL